MPAGRWARPCWPIRRPSRYQARILSLAYMLGVETVCRVSKAISVAPAQGGAALDPDRDLRRHRCGRCRRQGDESRSDEIGVGDRHRRRAGGRNSRPVPQHVLFADGRAGGAGRIEIGAAGASRASPASPIRSAPSSAFWKATSDVSDARALTDGLGTTFEILVQHLQALSVRRGDPSRHRCVPRRYG